MASVNVVYIPAEHVDDVWEPFAKGHLEKVLPMVRGYNLDSIKDNISKGHLQLWAVLVDALPIATFTTCIQTYPETKELECVHLGGEDMALWIDRAVVVLTEFAKENNCSALITMGRKGTEKLYKPYGFEFASVRLRKIL